MVKIFIEQPSTETLFPHRDQLKKILDSQNTSAYPTLSVTTSRDQADLIIIFIVGEATQVKYLNQVMSLSHENRATIILVPDRIQNGKPLRELDRLNFLRQVDGWIFGCRLPKKVPTPMIIGGDFPGILKNIFTVIRVR